MKRPVRILVEVIGPPAVGGTIAFAVFFAKEARGSVGSAVMLEALSVAYAYAFAFLPSCLYALTMEWSFGAGLKERSVSAVALSSILGSLAGFLIGYYLSSRLALTAGIYCAIGAATGLTVGVVVALFSKETEPNHLPDPTLPSVTPAAEQPARRA